MDWEEGSNIAVVRKRQNISVSPVLIASDNIDNIDSAVKNIAAFNRDVEIKLTMHDDETSLTTLRSKVG